MKRFTRSLVCINKILKAKRLLVLIVLSSFPGKLVFTEPIPKDNEAATWREKLDQLYKSSSQSYRVVVHGSKV